MRCPQKTWNSRSGFSHASKCIVCGRMSAGGFTEDWDAGKYARLDEIIREVRAELKQRAE